MGTLFAGVCLSITAVLHWRMGPRGDALIPAAGAAFCFGVSLGKYLYGT